MNRWLKFLRQSPIHASLHYKYKLGQLTTIITIIIIIIIIIITIIWDDSGEHDACRGTLLIMKSICPKTIAKQTAKCDACKTTRRGQFLQLLTGKVRRLELKKPLWNYDKRRIFGSTIQVRLQVRQVQLTEDIPKSTASGQTLYVIHCFQSKMCCGKQ